MDTHDKYLDDEFLVKLVPERFPDRGVLQHGVPRRHQKTPLANRLTGEQPPVDGWVTFYDPAKHEAGDPYMHGDYPFRDHRKDDAPWFANPDGDKWSRRPVWKWVNPEEPLSELTLKPSIGSRNRDGEITFHCYITNGEIEWL